MRCWMFALQRKRQSFVRCTLLHRALSGRAGAFMTQTGTRSNHRQVADLHCGCWSLHDGAGCSADSSTSTVQCWRDMPA